MDELVQNSSHLSFLFKFLNLFLIPVGLGTIITGIYLSGMYQSFSWYNGSFIGIGLATIIVAFIGHRSRYSIKGMNFYCLYLLLISVPMIFFSIAIFSYSSLSNKLGISNANAVKYSLLCFSVFMVITFFFGVLYRKLLKPRTFDYSILVDS
jgi:hypothetical protein